MDSFSLCPAIPDFPSNERPILLPPAMKSRLQLRPLFERGLPGPRSKPLRHAFTLLELLIVTAIVAILVALLFPVYGRIRLTADLDASSQNVRNLQLGNQQYANDHNGAYVPLTNWDETGATGASWYSDPEFRQYFGLSGKSTVWPLSMISPRSQAVNSQGQRCMQRSYGYNDTTLRTHVSWGTPNQRIQPRVTKVANPSRTIAFADAVDWQITIDGADLYPNPETYVASAIAYRYGGRAAVVFFDGHGGTVTRQEAVGNSLLWNIETP